MDLDALVARCQTRFSDLQGRAVSEAEWQAYVNDAYSEVISDRDWPFLETRSSSTVISAGTNSASLPTDVWTVLDVFNNTDGITVLPIHGRNTAREAFPDLTATGVPQFYRLFGDTIEVFPSAQANTTLALDYFVHPAELTASDEPVFPRPFHKILVDGALAYAYDDDGNNQQAAICRARFEQGIVRLVNHLLGARTGNYPQIVDSFF